MIMLFTGRAQGWPDSPHSHGDGVCKWEVTPPTDHLPSQKGARRSAEECQHRRRRQSRCYILQKMLDRVSLLASHFIYSLLLLIISSQLHFYLLPYIRARFPPLLLFQPLATIIKILAFIPPVASYHQ